MSSTDESQSQIGPLSLVRGFLYKAYAAFTRLGVALEDEGDLTVSFETRLQRRVLKEQYRRGENHVPLPWSGPQEIPVDLQLECLLKAASQGELWRDLQRVYRRLESEVEGEDLPYSEADLSKAYKRGLIETGDSRIKEARRLADLYEVREFSGARRPVWENQQSEGFRRLARCLTDELIAAKGELDSGALSLSEPDFGGQLAVSPTRGYLSQREE